MLTDRQPDAAPVTVELQTGDQPIVIETRDGAIHTRLGPTDDPDATLLAANNSAPVARVLRYAERRVPRARSRPRASAQATAAYALAPDETRERRACLTHASF
jgi:hypothetical protein